uniref:Photosystem I assembly protein Ycf3 n=1 Tax=Aegilops tauschii subsp. strangulata TaxID=200361 RepID=A0A453FW36_AEGTS
AILQGDSEIAEAWFDQAAEYWKQACSTACAGPRQFL